MKKIEDFQFFQMIFHQHQQELSLMKKTPSIDFTQLDTPKNHKPINNKKSQANQRNKKSYRHNSIYNDESQVLREELESKNQIINKLIETTDNISNKAVQTNPLPIPQLHFEDDSNDTNESEREEIKVPEIKNTSNNQKDSQQEMYDLNREN